MTSTRSPASARQAARLTAVVVLPTPPFWFAEREDRAGHALIVLAGGRYGPRRVGACGPFRAGGESREAWRHLGNDDRAGISSGSPPPSCPQPGHRRRVGARPDVEHDPAARPDERQAPLGCHGRRRESSRHRDAVRVDVLLLGPPAHDPNVRKFGGDALEERCFPGVRLEQRDLPVRQGSRPAGMPGEPPPEPTSTIGPAKRSTAGKAARLPST